MFKFLVNIYIYIYMYLYIYMLISMYIFSFYNWTIVLLGICWATSSQRQHWKFESKVGVLGECMNNNEAVCNFWKVKIFHFFFCNYLVSLPLRWRCPGGWTTITVRILRDLYINLCTVQFRLTVRNKKNILPNWISRLTNKTIWIFNIFQNLSRYVTVLSFQNIFME